MSVTASGLKTEVVDNINALSDEDKVTPSAVHDAVATGITDYLTANLIATGAYVGTVTGGPDPLNGTYTWGVSSMTLTGTQLQVAAATSFASWVLAIQTGIQTVTFLGLDSSSLITTSTPSLLTAYSLASLTQASLSGTDSMDTAWTTICSEIITNILTTIPVPVTATAVSTSPGTGTVTWSGVS